MFTPLIPFYVEFLGRTELPVATIKKDMENKGPSTKKLLLHEVPTGEVWVRLDFQLFDGRTPKWKEWRPVDVGIISYSAVDSPDLPYKTRCLKTSSATVEHATECVTFLFSKTCG